MEWFIGLKERMKKKLERYNSDNLDEFSDIVIYLSSDDILRRLKGDKFVDIVEINEKIRKTGELLCKKYGFDDVISFNNEISLIYLYDKQKQDNKNMIYDGNKNKLLSILASEASIIFSNIYSNGSEDSNSYRFSSRYIEFERENEIKDWYKWRQENCHNNIISLLYKLVINRNNESKSKSEMEKELNKYGILEQEEIKKMLE